MNATLREFHEPVNADVPPMEAILVDEEGPRVNAFGNRRVGEIGVTGSAGAIVNAIWPAAGMRVHDCPIMLEKLIQ